MRPLGFTVQINDEWEDGFDYFLRYFVLKLNGVEIRREKAALNADLDDAEEWARELVTKVLDMNKSVR